MALPRLRVHGKGLEASHLLLAAQLQRKFLRGPTGRLKRSLPLALGSLPGLIGRSRQSQRLAPSILPRLRAQRGPSVKDAVHSSAQASLSTFQLLLVLISSLSRGHQRSLPLLRYATAFQSYHVLTEIDHSSPCRYHQYRDVCRHRAHNTASSHGYDNDNRDDSHYCY